MATVAEPISLRTLEARVDDALERICHKLQLTATQYEAASQSYGAICNWLDDPESPLHVYHPSLYPQGSVALGTTVKPLKSDDYDVDVVCQLEIDATDITDPIDLLDLLEERLKSNAVYAPLVERKNRCIRINYERNLHLDILPARPDPARPEPCLLVPDRALNDWTASNPTGYIEWFKQRQKIVKIKMILDHAAPMPTQEPATDKHVLQLAVQLIKRWRDVHFAENPELAPISIVLTTLVAHFYDGSQSLIETLINVADKIVGAIPSVGRLVVHNPANSEEDLSERWIDEDIYRGFAEGMKVLRSQVHQLRAASNIQEAAKLIESMFGETVAKSALSEQYRELNEIKEAGALRIKPSSAGRLTTSVAAAIPVARHTFFGD
jgi:hypothetical protein